MEDGATHLRDRMLRDAIVEVLRGPFDPAGQGADISLVDAGLVGHVAVDEDRVRVELPLPANGRHSSVLWPPRSSGASRRCPR